MASWFDKLTANGENPIPFALSLPKGGPIMLRISDSGY